MAQGLQCVWGVCRILGILGSRSPLRTCAHALARRVTTLTRPRPDLTIYVSRSLSLPLSLTPYVSASAHTILAPRISRIGSSGWGTRAYTPHGVTSR
eukprot:7612570-Pyramimonas_sp.AAC.1